MKNRLKNFIPHPVLLFFRRLTVFGHILSVHAHQIKRELSYSNSIVWDKTSRLSGLLVSSHVLEKGITMPECRLGFGKERVNSIIRQCKECIKDYGSDNLEIQAAIADLVQYRNLHIKENYKMPTEVVEEIDALEKELNLSDENCYNEKKDCYFKIASDFKEFAWQRHAVRWYSGKKVSKEKLLDAIQLAQSAPSACNRQSVRVRIIEDKLAIDKICSSIQNGCRGFGEKADKWLLVTSDQRCWSGSETSLAYVDGGIFVMNLLYALHYYEIGACPLNALLEAKKEKELQDLIKYNPAEIPILFIAIGDLPDQFMIAKSRRLRVDEIYSLY